MTYCEYVNSSDSKDMLYHKVYHDNFYGFPIYDDNELFGRLVMEINQAGINWLTILKKEQNLRSAYSNFDVASVAHYSEADRERLLNDVGIIRNKLKVNAAIYNANVILEIQKSHGSFKHWLDMNHPKSREEWVRLFKKTFKFTGGEITSEFLLSTGYLEGAHQKNCPIYAKIIAANPAWLR